MTDQQVQGWA